MNGNTGIYLIWYAHLFGLSAHLSCYYSLALPTFCRTLLIEHIYNSILITKVLGKQLYQNYIFYIFLDAGVYGALLLTVLCAILLHYHT